MRIKWVNINQDQHIHHQTTLAIIKTNIKTIIKTVIEVHKCIINVIDTNIS